MAKKREEVAIEDQWDVASLYPNDATWHAEFNQIKGSSSAPFWPEIESYKGSLAKGSAHFRKVMDRIEGISRQLEKLYTYAHLRHDENLANDGYKSMNSMITSLYHAFSQETSWFEPEILALAQEKLNEYLHADELKEYRFKLEKLVRMKPHTLSQDKEEMMAQAGQALQAVQKAFSSLTNADFNFGTVCDQNGKEHELTHGRYSLYLHSHDRSLRKNAFEKMMGHFRAHENTLCELIGGQVQSHLFNAKARKYKTCLEAAIFPKNIPTTVYKSLIEAVHKKIGALHRYVRLRKEKMGLDFLHLYDMYTPLTKEIEVSMSYKEAEQAVADSVAPLGNEYQNLLRKGLFEQRWVDRFENTGKRSGAYSSGCYDSNPYILMNYSGTLRDVFTLAHEAGHSMHSLYSKTHQPYHYSSYPIFVAEVASTFNEQLLTRHLLKNASSTEEKIYLINQKIEDIRATLFRQTMFAEFELAIHEMAENHEPITPAALKAKHLELNKFYFGEEVVVDELISSEWSRIPHFYYNFYVYQYATGLSAAIALSKKVTEGGIKERDAYLKFLSGGCSKYPIDLLKDAGVDMSRPEPVLAAIDHFDELVTELEALLEIGQLKA
jgi:oligoendopeptidase F